MLLETIILTAVITAAAFLALSRWPLVAGVWRRARWWERLLLVGALAPIPGPLDELVGLLALRRIARRGA
jgi:hypothetical protein